ncbi:MAG TPA: transglutaminase family protein, partial [Polyangiaceae bacterium]|nr:transglutaminase family protein [Polyangiaceae bacterium]
DMTVTNPFDFFVEADAERFPFAYTPSLRRSLAPYLAATPDGPRFAEFVERARSEDARPERRTVDVLVDLNRRVHRALRYDVRMEPGVFEPEETLVRGHGSCRDFAWLLVRMLRCVGIAARFVSGYSIQLRADERPLDGPAGVDSDVTDLHAWAEAFLPGAGWVGLDATSGLLAGEGHIPLACTPEPDTAAAVSGSFTFAKRDDDDRVKEGFDFSMNVSRLRESPRVTLPYSEETWEKIHALGREVDRELVAGDVRLTMGGEPTFVSASEPDAAEWNTDALGPRKRAYATRLVHRLYDRFTPGGLLHEGQGKWYPGEPLPRWALSCYFRKDGLPVWNDATLFARAETGEDTAADAQRFVEDLARRLGVETTFAIPAYEDAFYYLWRERRLPLNVDPFDSKLIDELERARLARVFEQGLDRVVGYALPLAPAASGGASAPEGRREDGLWRSGPWFLRPERLYLLPGDSPMGYRLPLDGLPWALPEDVAQAFERDPFADRGRLPARVAFDGRQGRAVAPVVQDRGSRATQSARSSEARERTDTGTQGEGAPQAPARLESSADVVRTALCVEPRRGVLHVFMPPIALVEDYLDLCAAVEATAASTGKKVRLEGYHPPTDHRLGRLQVTPDPGVIEVNVHPAATWDDLVTNTCAFYDEARAVGLRADKFMLDGRHSGTGGGNHIVLGGPTAADSPVLRRPELLSSLIGYWLNHPSLSYLFSGLFVGPTSQSPRADEARNDSLYELEIARREIEKAGGARPPWFLDRTLRNLLIDVTGNTHRTEFCIDKLYAPEGPADRQGLVELRSFEMPPHARMSLAQQLLVRALVAAFWRRPYRVPAVYWGTTLHDRFMLPHFVEQDFADVLEDLSAAGFAFPPGAFAPHHEFRFPHLGEVVTRDGLVLELRQAIEPWHVLGEEAALGGTARYVDSSVERVQVKVRGMTDERHCVACNGRRVPLHPTGTPGEFVAGVRFRAWAPPSALHPSIPVHSPLVFDVVDRWNARSVGGMTYQVAHPGGRSFDVFPRNSFEAESRRVARFQPFGHSPGAAAAAAMAEPAPNPRFPFTLDLRR